MERNYGKQKRLVCYENFEGEVQIYWVNKNKEIKIKADKFLII